MIRTQMVACLDYAKPRKKDPPVQHEQFSYRRDGVWFIANTGPGYCNTYRVTEFDEAGEKLLQERERKEESSP